MDASDQKYHRKYNVVDVILNNGLLLVCLLVLLLLLLLLWLLYHVLFALQGPELQSFNIQYNYVLLHGVLVMGWLTY